MSKTATLERALSAKGKQGLELLSATMATCEEENREMTADERAAIDALSAECKGLQAKIERLRGDETLARELEALSTGLSTKAAGLLKPSGATLRIFSLGDQFT